MSLTRTRAERDLQDSLAEVFSIIVTLDEIEKAFIKDAIPQAEYSEICDRSLRQYKALLADEAVAKEFGSIEQFKAKWDVSSLRQTALGKPPFFANPPKQLEVPRATERLRSGVSITIEQPAGTAPAPSSTAPPTSNTSGVLILEATQEFITFLDAVKLGFLSKDQLHPLLSDVIQSVNKVTDKDFENRGKIVQWLITLNQMKASEELSEQQARELDMDIQQAYQGFRQTLQ